VDGRGESGRGRLAGVAAGVVALHVAGVALVLAFAGAHAGLVAAALTAYTLGVRHGFDADHIAAIDNTTRRLRARGDRSLSVGFFFALGHSSVVLVLTIVLALGASGVPDLGAIPGAVSGGFLWVVGLLNLAVLASIVRTSRDRRPAGVLMKLGLDRPLRRVVRPIHMLPLGALFGLGFETATAVALLALGAGSSAAGLPLLAVVALPLLFAAGMTAVDSANGIAMARAYDWALDQPLRRLRYNLVITGLSAGVALGIGTLQLAHVEVDMEALGLVVAATLLFTWLAAIAFARVRSEEAPA
jgi:high-affinity nickel-transport protein